VISSRTFSDVAIVLPLEIKRLPEDLSRFLSDLVDNPNLNLRFVGLQIPQSSMNYTDKCLELVTWLEQKLFSFSRNSTASCEKYDLLLKLIQKQICPVSQSFKADLVIDFTNHLDVQCQTPIVTVNTLLLANEIEMRSLFHSVLNRENFSNGFLQLLDSSTNRTRHLRFQLMTRKYLSHNLVSMRGTELGLLRLLVNDSKLLNKFVDNQSEGYISSLERLSLFKLFEYFSYGIFNFLQNRYRSFFNLNPLWSIQIRDLGNSKRGIRAQINARRGTNDFCADPFLWEFDGKMYCFFEYFDSELKLGKISYVCLEDGASGVIADALVEDFHLSFPYLFEYEGEIYLCPETSSKNEIRIYRCLDFPSKWVYSKTIMKDINAADTVLFEDKGVWWMLTNIDIAGIGDHSIFLSAFHADSPISTHWTPHLNNPIRMSATCARNAGFVQTPNGLYRGSQSQAFNSYGKSAALHKILTLSESEYSEAEAEIPNEVAKENLDAFHHIDVKSQVLAFDCIVKRSLKNG
jgi:hypothetical protein